jgi:hypothetical protein
MHRSALKRGTAAVVALAFTFALTACGDDDDESADETTSTTAAADEAAAYCEPFFEFQGKLFDSPDDPAAGLTYLKDELIPLISQIEEGAAGTEAEEPATALAERLRSVKTAEDFGEVGGEFESGGPAIQHFSSVQLSAADECGYEKVEVDAVDYAFEGVPEDLEAGKYAFVMTNTSEAEPHEMIWFKVKPDVTETLDEILALGDEEAQGKIEQAGGGFAPPGGQGVIFLELDDARYGYVCFIPVGGGDDGPPHFTEGMKGELTVG